MCEIVACFLLISLQSKPLIACMDGKVARQVTCKCDAVAYCPCWGMQHSFQPGQHLWNGPVLAKQPVELKISIVCLQVSSSQKLKEDMYKSAVLLLYRALA